MVKLTKVVALVWRAPNDYRLGREIDKMHLLAAKVRPKLDWLQRECWDCGLEFNPPLQLMMKSVFRQGDENPHTNSIAAPRCHPTEVNEVVSRVREKSKALDAEILKISTLVEKLQADYSAKVKAAWDTYLSEQTAS